MSDITIYENLANAIILQAVKDYRMALKSLKANSREGLPHGAEKPESQLP